MRGICVTVGSGLRCLGACAAVFVSTTVCTGNRSRALPHKTAGAAAKPTEVLVSFDTEDFTNPRSADGIRKLVDICDEEGITAHFEVVGLMAEALERWGRRDVIAKMRRHLIGTHTWSHSIHPDTMEESDIEDFDAAYRTVRAHEEKSVETLKRVFGVDRVWNSVPPGNSEPYVVSRVYADLGIRVDLGPTWLGYDSDDIWYAGQRRIVYGYCFETFQNPGFRYEPEKILDQLAKKRRFAIYCHPNRVHARKFWDGINYNGTNACAFGEWKFSEELAPEETTRYLSRVRDILRRIKADPRFRIVTLPELYATEKPRVAITAKDVPALRAKLEKELGPLDAPASWCVADVFCAAVRFLRGEKSFLPDNAYGFLYAPRGVTSETRLARADLIAAAKAMDVSKWLPHEIRVGNATVGPADFLFAALETLETGAEMVTVRPREQLGSFRELPLLETINYRGTWVHTPQLRDDWCSNRMRWQLWTLRHE